MANESSGSSGGGAHGAGGGVRGPVLVAGGYASWRPSMHSFLQANGAESIHCNEDLPTLEEWTDTSEFVAALQKTTVATAKARLGIGRAKAEPSRLDEAKAEAADAELLAARREVTAQVRRSERVHAILFAAIPVELRSQIPASVPAGWAFGLWKWLQSKFESTEADSVFDLLEQWTALKQADGEDFDTWRARVTKLNGRMEDAGEKLSAHQVAHVLLGRLQPRYKPAVLALRASDKLKDIGHVDWDAIAAYINAYERSEQREGAAAAEATAMAAMRGGDSRSWSNKAANGSGTGSSDMDQRGAHRSGGGNTYHANRKRGGGLSKQQLDETQCYNCKKLGHMAKDCTMPDRRAGKQQPQQQQAHSAAGDAAVAGVGPGVAAAAGGKPTPRTGQAHAAQGANRFDALSSDDEEADEEGDDEEQGKDADHDKVAASSAASNVELPESSGVTYGVALQKGADALAIGVDTMASVNVSGQLKHLVNVRPCRPMHVTVANGRIVTATECGSLKLRAKTTDGRVVSFMIRQVYYHPEFNINLISWGRLLEQDWSLRSDKRNGSRIWTPDGVEIALTQTGGLSWLKVEAAASAQVCAAGGEKVDSVAVDALVRLHGLLASIA